MTEIQIISILRQRAQGAARNLIVGIGDDCAVYRTRGGNEDLVFTTDMLIEEVHFRTATHRPAEIGWKTLARGLSDIAAMGAVPRFCLLSLALPEWADKKWISRFYDGLLELAEQHDVILAGGDLARTEKLTCDIVICGAVPKGGALLRSGAQPGDSIYVSGELGASALGLATQTGAAWRRHKKPEPRLELGRFLREKLHATAAMDLSDGLSLDLHRLCLESKVSAELNEPVPVFHGASIEQALHGGEDYELLFTVPKTQKVPALYKGLPLTRIGSIERGEPGEVMLFGTPLAPLGYDHLRKP